MVDSRTRLECINVSHGIEFLQSEELYWDMVKMFRDALPGVRYDIEKAYNESRFFDLHIFVHSLKTSSCYIGALSISDCCRDFQSALEQKPIHSPTINQFFSTLSSHLDHLTIELQILKNSTFSVDSNRYTGQHLRPPNISTERLQDQVIEGKFNGNCIHHQNMYVDEQSWNETDTNTRFRGYNSAALKDKANYYSNTNFDASSSISEDVLHLRDIICEVIRQPHLENEAGKTLRGTADRLKEKNRQHCAMM